MLKAFRVVHYAPLLSCTFAVSRPQTFFNTPPNEPCLRSRLFGGRGNCRGCLIFWRGGLLFPRGRSHIETATLSRATLKLPRLAGGRGFIKTPRPKLPRKGGTGGRVFHPCARPGRRVEGLGTRQKGPGTRRKKGRQSILPAFKLNLATTYFPTI